MTQKQNIKLDDILQVAINSDDDFLKSIAKLILQYLLELERDDQIGVDRYERDNEHRTGSRNGYKPRTFNTRLGKMHLLKPEIREYPFETQLFDKYQRSEKALMIAMRQMVISGVSTNRIKKITRKLSPDLKFSKSTISLLMKALDPVIEQWRNEKLKEHYEYLISDAIYLYVRNNGKVSNRPVLISIGIDSNGYRKILGLDISYSEDEQSWSKHLQNLKDRGLKSFNLTISDANKGLVNSLEKEFSGIPHQRCMVHFMRNLLSLVPHKEKKTLSEAIKHIFLAPNREMAIKISHIIIERYERLYPRVSRLLEKSLDETLTFYNYPKHHQRKIRTTNLIENLNSQIKRRSKVVNIFPNEESCVRYISALLQEIDEDWQTGRKYIKIEEEKKKEKNHQTIKRMFKKIKEVKSTKINQTKTTVA